MTTVGFIGLGIMGLPMAKNLVNAGYTVLGHNRSRHKVDELVTAGGQGAASAGEAVKGADIVITMLPDSPDVEAVVLGDDGVLAHSHPGQLFVDMSTIKPATSQAIAEEGAKAGLRVLDAPVSGGEAGAVEGVLSIMVGGEPADFAAARPVLDVLGTTVVHVGAHGAGQAVKAANQLIVAGNIQLLS
jgi:2-hydroxy-3-oxopropionate reductase